MKTILRGVVVISVVVAFANVRADDAQRTDDRDRSATPEFETAVQRQAGSAPSGVQTLILGKDTPNGDVTLSWSFAAPTNVLRRWSAIPPAGAFTILPLSGPPTTSYNDHVLFDGINECWSID